VARIVRTGNNGHPRGRLADLFSEVALMPDALQFAAVEKRPDHGRRSATRESL